MINLIGGALEKWDTLDSSTQDILKGLGFAATAAGFALLARAMWNTAPELWQLISDPEIELSGFARFQITMDAIEDWVGAVASGAVSVGSALAGVFFFGKGVYAKGVELVEQVKERFL